MKKKLFVISDLHGHYKETIEALKEAKYDENNDTHLLIVIGDLFDRGTESHLIYNWLYQLHKNNKAIILRGNHEKFFIDWLEGNNDNFNYERNGLKNTINSFLQTSYIDFISYCVEEKIKQNPEYNQRKLWFHWCRQARNIINNNHPELIDWLKNLPYYYETKNYIFTHGSIDVNAKDWHTPEMNIYGVNGWEACTWDDGSFFGKTINNTDKTVIIGHFDTFSLRLKYGLFDLLNNDEKYSILTRDDGKVIAIDSCTILTKKVNVLVIDNEEI